MKNEKLLRAIGGAKDKYVREAAPRPARKQLPLRMLLPIAACFLAFALGSAVFAAGYIRNSASNFYLRYLSPEEMAVADSMAEQYGAKVYFDGLKSDDMYKQYFSINKLVEYFNDDDVRPEAVRAITPFLASGEEKLADAAAFALSVLEKRFDDPRIVRLADGTVIFTLFNDYSDYGSYNEIWMVKDGELSVLDSFDRPKMYITQLLPSPDGKLFAIAFASNRSSYLMIWDLENGMVSPELVDSARVKRAADKGYMYWQRIDNDNYSEATAIEWIGDGTIAFDLSMAYNGMEFVEDARVTFDFRQKKLEYRIVEE